MHCLELTLRKSIKKSLNITLYNKHIFLVYSSTSFFQTSVRIYTQTLQRRDFKFDLYQDFFELNRTLGSVGKPISFEFAGVIAGCKVVLLLSPPKTITCK